MMVTLTILPYPEPGNHQAPPPQRYSAPSSHTARDAQPLPTLQSGFYPAGHEVCEADGEGRDNPTPGDNRPSPARQLSPCLCQSRPRALPVMGVNNASIGSRKNIRRARCHSAPPARPGPSVIVPLELVGEQPPNTPIP
jgi:hypothetical protein